MLRALDLKENNLCKRDISENDDLFIYYNMICNLYLCDPLFVNSVFTLIEINNTNVNFNSFLNYFKSTYISKYQQILGIILKMCNLDSNFYLNSILIALLL